MSPIKGQQRLSSLTVTSVFTRERSVQFLTQLSIKKKKPKKTHLQGSIRGRHCLPLLVQSWAYCYPSTLCMISETKEAVDHATCKTFPILFQQYWQFDLKQHCDKLIISDFPQIRENSRISRGNTDKISVHLLFYCRRSFAQWDKLSLRIFV